MNTVKIKVQFKASLDKQLARSHLSKILFQQISWVWWYLPVILAMRGMGGRIKVLRPTQAKSLKSYLKKNNYSKEGWGHGSSGRALA
jgi:hypothetical protein